MAPAEQVSFQLTAPQTKNFEWSKFNAELADLRVMTLKIKCRKILNGRSSV
jgi:hypothetical protein